MGNGSFLRELGWMESRFREGRFLNSGNRNLRMRPGMAKYATLALIFVTLVGCQAHQGQVVDTLPQPNFNGPLIAQAPPVPKYTPPAPSQPQRSLSGPQAWIPQVPPRPWKWIVIHHSASPTGSAAIFDREHKAKGWDGVGYHFVIGNGTNSGNGQVEVTARWPIQKWGAHAKTPDNRFNDYGIGICLVGNFEIERPTAAQMASLEKLVAFLMQRYNIPPERVLRHKDTKSTECPGRNLNIDLVRRAATQIIVNSGGNVEHIAAADATELLTDTPAH